MTRNLPGQLDLFASVGTSPRELSTLAFAYMRFQVHHREHGYRRVSPQDEAAFILAVRKTDLEPRHFELGLHRETWAKAFMRSVLPVLDKSLPVDQVGKLSVTDYGSLGTALRNLSEGLTGKEGVARDRAAHAAWLDARKEVAA